MSFLWQKKPVPTRYDMYLQTIAQLQEAADALDQAISSMRDARVDCSTKQGISGGLQSANDVRLACEGLIADLKDSQCDECGAALPCSCAWLRAEIGRG